MKLGCNTMNNSNIINSHRDNNLNNEIKNQIAIFWDYENIKVIAEGINVPLAEALLSYSKSIGHPYIKRVYGDWAKTNKIIIQALYSLGFEPIQVSMGKTNSVDVKIAVDCLDTAMLHPVLNCFIIITGDKDFIPVVNWLKAHQKEVTIISKPENVSEHLLMSADKFISLEEISKKFNQEDVQTSETEEILNLEFDNAVKYLIQTIEKIRDQGKSTRYGVVDNYMRSSLDYSYNGASSVLLPNKTGTFKSFSKFIEKVEEAGKIKTETIKGFKEIFLIEENPQEESEFSQTPSDKIELNYWNKIINTVILTINEGKKESKKIIKNKLFDDLKEIRKKGEIPSYYYNSILRSALDILIEINFIKILTQPSGKIELAEDHEENLETYIDKAFKNQ